MRESRRVKEGGWMKNSLILAVFLGIVLLAGCTQLEGIVNPNSGGSTGTGGYGTAGAVPEAVRSSGANYYAAPAPTDMSPSDQKLIKTGNAEVEVPSGTLQEKYAKFKSLIASNGGQITSSDYQESDTTKEYNIQVKVPPKNFENLAALLQGIGTVKSMNSNVQDVGEQYVDIDTRIKNLQIQREELLKLYERNGTLEEILAVENEVTRVQTEIEMYQTQKLNIDRQVAMSAVWVRIYEQAPVVNKGIFDTLLSDVANIFLGALGLAIVVVSALLGFGIPVVIAIAILYWVYRRLFPAKGGKR